MTTKIPDYVFEEKRLDKEYHARLIADLDRVAELAAIPPKMVYSRLSQYCTGDDLTWVRGLKKGDQPQGLVYIGKYTIPVEDKMMAITGACLRNFIDARMMPVQEVISRLKSDDMPHPTVLLIPNFCLEKGEGGDIAQWHISSLLGLLYTRMTKNLKTVLYVGSLSALEKNYGESFRNHIESHYLAV